MISGRNPARDGIAFANAATTGFTRELGPVSYGSLAAAACIEVLRDTGLAASDVDGICGSTPSAAYVQSALGIPEITWFANPPIPFINQVVAAMGAIAAGQCEVVLAYHAVFRDARSSRSAAKDPFRRVVPHGAFTRPGEPSPLAGTAGYAAWAARYLHEWGADREVLGLLAINGRSNARDNPAAVMRDPLSMDDYLDARMVQWPLGILDMDVPVDGADAFVITTAERALDMPHTPVLVNAATLGQIDQNDEAQTPSLQRNGQHVVAEALRRRSDVWLDDIDLYYAYDGFTIIELAWFESIGWCGPGEAGAFVRDNWDAAGERILINGAIPVNSHGGALSEGATQGSGHVREAVLQLQGRAGPRQRPDAAAAMVVSGGFFTNPQGMTLRRGG